jgi:hypothetical protein
MSKTVDKSSAYAIPPEVDLFRVPYTLTGVRRIRNREFTPLHAMNSNGPYFFRSYRENSHIKLDTSTFKAELQVVNKDGTKLAVGANVAFDKNVLTDFVSRVVFDINGIEVTNTGGNHAHRAHIENLCTSASYRADQLSVSGWVEDYGEPDDPKNTSYIARKALVAESKSVFVQGRLHFDMANQDKLLPSMIDLALSIHRNDDKFILVNFDDDKEYAVRVKSLRWYVDVWELNEGMSATIESKLSNEMAKFAFKKTEVRNFNIPTGRKDAPEAAIITGILPTRIIIGLVSGAGYRGDFKRSAHNFQHFNLRNINVEFGEEQIPLRPYMLNYAADDYCRAFVDFYDAIGLRGKNHSTGIDYARYKNGFCLYGFRLSPVDPESGSFDFKRSGVTSVRIELGEAAEGPFGIEVLMLCETDEVLYFDDSRNLRSVTSK